VLVTGFIRKGLSNYQRLGYYGNDNGTFDVKVETVCCYYDDDGTCTN
jgi:hypothetical protein